MKKLQGEGIGPMGSHRNRNASIEWEIQIELLDIWGKVQLTPMKRKCRSLSDELGKLLTLEAPPIVVVESVRDSIALIKVWQAGPITRRAGVGAISSTIEVSFAQCEASGIGQVAAALAHAKMQSFRFCLQDFVANDGRMGDGRTGQAIANAGFLFSVLCSGRTVCHLNGVTDFPALERHKSITCLEVIYSHVTDLRFCALFSAIAEGKMIRRLHVRTYNDDGRHRDPLHWKWLAYTLWSRTSNACIPVLNLGRVNLTEEHVSAVEAVLKYSYPQPAEHPELSSISHSEYGFANIQSGTELRSVGLRAGDDSVLVVSRELRCRAHCKSSAKQLDVVVPGYGICTMANVDVFESDNVVGSSSRFLDTTETPCGVNYLIMSFSGIENDHLLPRFLALTGGRLQTLCLCTYFLLARSLGLDLCSVACPELQTLSVSNFEVTFSDGNEALRYWKIKKLQIGGSDVDSLIRLLDDPTHRTSRELVELRLNRRSHGRQVQSRFTPDDLSALKAHDGEFLPVVKKKFPPSSQNAFIRLLRCRPAGRLLDSNMLTIFLGFAAIPEQRRVVIL